MRNPECVLAHRCLLGESPLWDARDHTLIYVDILRGHLHRLDTSSGELATFEVAAPLGAAAPRQDSGFVLALGTNFATFEPASGELGPLRPIKEERLPGSRLNDGKCDPSGRFWAGTRSDRPDARGGWLHRLDPDGAVTAVLSGVGTSNGLDWSDDGRTFYFIDTALAAVDAFDFDAENGSLGQRRRLITLDAGDGVPDGMTIDSDGGIWVALFGGSAIRRYTPEGSLDLEIAFPVSLVTSCAFGGDDLCDLYVTSAAHRLAEPEPLAGSLFYCDTGFRGRPCATYAG